MAMTYDEWNGTDETAALPEKFWTDSLNPAQWEAVRHTSGPLLVIAGAGSGKTRVLTYKVAYLLQHGYYPWQVLALTFTNKAAAEMTKRIVEIAGADYARGLWSGTFHSIFSKILRIEGEQIGLNPNFTVCDSDDQQKMLKAIVKEMGLDEKTYRAKTIASRISEAKNHLLLPEDYAQTASMMDYDKHNSIGETHRIYRTYWERCRKAQLVDFDDMLLYTHLLLSRSEETRRKYAERFKYILVDEYQDTNYVQYRILELLTRDHHNICVVGDDAQSIYGFRGANIENILRFNKQYPEAVTIKLEQNYRSTQTIVNAANDIIRHNRRQIPKTVFSEKEAGDPLVVISAANDRDEAAKICGRIKRLRKDGVGYDKVAILYRTNAQSRPLEETFLKNNVPYRVYAGQSFYERKEIKDVLAYLRLVVNLGDEVAFRRIVNYPARGIGETTQQKLLMASHSNGVPAWAVMEDPERFDVKLNRGTLAKLEKFAEMIHNFRQMAQETEAYEMVKAVVCASGIVEDLKKEDGPDEKTRQENVDELLAGIYNFVQDKHSEQPEEKVLLKDYLAEVALMTDADKHDDGSPRVTLMTVHSAKGLEFDTVFIAGMEQNLFPSPRSAFSPKELEEERRLFYVAVTRAERRCFLSYAESRFRNGNFEESGRSEFLDEIDRKYLRYDNGYETMPRGYARDTALFPSFAPKRATASLSRTRIMQRPGAQPQPATTGKVATVRTKSGVLNVGDKIMHQRFGTGWVESLEGSGENAMAVIDFAVTGKKKLLLKFAVFAIIHE